MYTQIQINQSQHAFFTFSGLMNVIHIGLGTLCNFRIDESFVIIIIIIYISTALNTVFLKMLMFTEQKYKSTKLRKKIYLKQSELHILKTHHFFKVTFNEIHHIKGKGGKITYSPWPTGTFRSHFSTILGML